MASKTPSSSAVATAWYAVADVNMPSPPCSHLQSDISGRDSRSNTLTFHTFRPTAVAQSPPTMMKVVGNPNSPGYEPNAYRPVFGNKRAPTAHINNIYGQSYTYNELDILVRLNDVDSRVGFSISGGVDEQLDTIVNNILSGSAADRAGLCIGDEIIEVNGVSVDGRSHAQIVQLIQTCIKSRTIQLRVRRKHDPSIEKSITDGDARVTDAYLVSVDREQKRDIEKKLKRNYPGVKTFDMETLATAVATTTADHKSITAAQNGQQHQGSVIVVNADDDDVDDDVLTDQMERLRKYELELKKRREKEEMKTRENAFLRASLRGSKRLQALENNNRNNDATVAEESVAYSNKCYIASDISYREELSKHQQIDQQSIPLDQVIVSVNRVADHLQNNEGRENDSKFIREYFTQPPIQDAIKATAAVHQSQQQQQHSSTSLIAAANDAGLKVVKLIKADDSYLGATVRNDGDRVIVGRVVKGGIAEKSRLLHDGDELLEVNGIDLRGKNVTEVCEMLRLINGELTFVVLPSSDKPSTSSVNRTNNGSKSMAPSVVHMRALFDYEPEDDFYVPCKELALKFQRGDILHVISMNDENWWQAYRDGDDPSQTLAGLIPSSSFQQQVIRYNRDIERENSSINGSSKLDKDLFGCKKKTNKNKKRTVGNQRTTIIGKELTPIDEMVVVENDDDEIFTYEDVSLYLLKTGRKRPVVLCGPEGVGCLELRQKLMQIDKERFAGVVPHTTRPKRPNEQDGVHYHFVTKQKFQDDSRMSKFIEWGEYQKHLYGTSFASIKSVVDRGKICLLTLKAQSLKALRSTDLMPYIIFVAPPALQQLRRQKEKAGQYNIKDDELKAILADGKQIEHQFGHYFDRLIVNVDFDRSLNELKDIIRRLETEPQWIPSQWLIGNNR